METVLLTVKTNPSNNGVDLELPTNLPLDKLIPGVIETLNLSIKDFYTAHRVRNGKIGLVFQVKQSTMPFIRISDDSTLEQAGVFDGAILLIEPGTQPVFSDIKCRPPKESMPCLQDIVSCKTFSCRQDRNLIGRDKQQDNPIHIDLKPLMPSASMASRKHALIYRNESKQWFIRDEGSSNGTLLNGRLLSKEQPERLRNRDQIQFGRLGPVLVFHLPAN
jgi:uncharacterized ubiquitin-like protein YukD